MTNPVHEELAKLEAERAELIAKNEAATSWGAAVGARSERIKGLDGRMAALRRLASSDDGVKGEPEPVAWQGMDTVPKGYPTEDAGCRGPSEWFIGRPSKKYRSASPIVVIRRRAWPQDDHWEDNGETYYRPDYFDGWRSLSLYTAPPADAGMREALELAHGKFCKIAGTENWTDSCLDGWRRSPGALRDYAEQAAKEVDAALTAPGATFSKRQMLECILLSLNVDGVYLNSLTVGELRRAL